MAQNCHVHVLASHCSRTWAALFNACIGSWNTRECQLLPYASYQSLPEIGCPLPCNKVVQSLQALAVPCPLPCPVLCNLDQIAVFETIHSILWVDGSSFLPRVLFSEPRNVVGTVKTTWWWAEVKVIQSCVLWKTRPKISQPDINFCWFVLSSLELLLVDPNPHLLKIFTRPRWHPTKLESEVLG